MKVIDAHCHIYPSKIARRASESVGAFYAVPMHSYDPVSEDLLSHCQGSPIVRHLVHSVALKPEQVQPINDFVAGECARHSEFVGFCTLHQDFPEPEKEIERAIEMGLVGLKLHPDTQKVFIDDPRLMEIYEIIEGRMPVVIHCGDYRHPYSHPTRLKTVLKTFPDLVVDAAHMGGWSIFNRAVDILSEERCFLDTSSSLPFLGPRRLRELIGIYGVDRVLFGSDYPMWDPLKDLEAIASAGFTDDELEKILWKNCEAFLGKRLT